LGQKTLIPRPLLPRGEKGRKRRREVSIFLLPSPSLGEGLGVRAKMRLEIHKPKPKIFKHTSRIPTAFFLSPEFYRLS
jgi:hypothetical protein